LEQAPPPRAIPPASKPAQLPDPRQIEVCRELTPGAKRDNWPHSARTNVRQRDESPQWLVVDPKGRERGWSVCGMVNRATATHDRGGVLTGWFFSAGISALGRIIVRGRCKEAWRGRYRDAEVRAGITPGRAPGQKLAGTHRPRPVTRPGRVIVGSHPRLKIRAARPRRWPACLPRAQVLPGAWAYRPG